MWLQPPTPLEMPVPWRRLDFHFSYHYIKRQQLHEEYHHSKEQIDENKSKYIIYIITITTTDILYAKRVQEFNNSGIHQ